MSLIILFVRLYCAMGCVQERRSGQVMDVASFNLRRYLTIQHESAFCHIQFTTKKMQCFWIFYFYRCSKCFGRFLRPSSGAHNCTYSFRYCQPVLLLAAIVDEMERSVSSTTAASSSIGWQYLKLYLQLCAPDDGRRNRPKHVEHL